MGLVVVERFSVLSEAQAARGALQSAGVFATIAEENHGVCDPLIHVCIGGFRLCVPAADLADALALLTDARREAAATDPTDIPPDNRTWGWIAGTLAGFLLLGGEGGFAVESVRRRAHVWPYALTMATTAFVAIIAAYLLAGWEDPCEPGSRRAQSEPCRSR